ncbi:integrin alpha-7-like [Acanthaster planci]|uniref:Integrin alpha-7-like n=1 Tax=Acanthaster planci TaxID=133434 RepID=A0A8B7YBT4_ACAPL|nr:integrin alpha-7-like [Acanthaster planci]
MVCSYFKKHKNSVGYFGTSLQNFTRMGTIRERGYLCSVSIVFVALQIVRIECYNLETRLPIVKEGPFGSSFGLSVAEHTVTRRRPSPTDGYNGSLILVGAPTYSAPDAIVPKTGGVFKCPLSTLLDDCVDLKLDQEGNEPGENKTDEWLGVTVKSQGPGGKVAACAHRYKAVSSEEISGLGRFIREDEDGFGGEYIAGLPGAGDWRGGVFSVNVIGAEGDFFERSRSLLVDESTGVGLNSYLGFSVTSGKFGPHFLVASGAPRYRAIGAVVMLAKAGTDLMMQSIIEGEQQTESFGYEVCSADLDGDGFDDLLVGAPIYYDRTTEAGGRVYIYLNKHHNGSFGDVEPIRLTGPKDSMFGIAITNLGDLNLDGFEDIAIGAPYENNGEGAVYIYLGGPDGVMQPASQKIMPSDLPYDLQTSRENRSAFGYSVSGGIDLDGNQYPELSIGAFEANTIVTLRARPIINVTAELLLQTSEIDANATNAEYKGKPTYRFYVQVRMKYICNADNFDAPIEVMYSIEAEEERRALGLTSRIIFEATDSYAIRDLSLDLRPQSEEIPKRSTEYIAYLRPGFKDIFRKIPFKLTYWLREVNVDPPLPGEPLPDINELPILNSLYDPSYVAQSRSSSRIFQLDFIKACAQDDGKCITDLDLRATLRLEGTPPTLRKGEHNELIVDVELKNKEEPAYDAKLTITFPEMLVYNKDSQHIGSRCNQLPDNKTVILCELGNPYPESHDEFFTVKFFTSDVPPDAGNFTITMVVTSTNEDSHPEDNHITLYAEVESITDMELSGETNREHYTFGGVVRGESAMEYTDQIGEEVIHTWKIYNKGPDTVPESELTISFPFEVANGKWLLYMTHMPEVRGNRGHCEIDPIYVNELKIKERPRSPYDLYTTAAPTSTRSLPPSTRVPSTEASLTTGAARRKKRAAGGGAGEQEEVSRPQRSSKGQPLKGQTVGLACSNKTATCFDFKCHFDSLAEEETVLVVVRSRLWNSTFQEDYINVEQVFVGSVGRIKILNAPYLIQSDLENDEFDLTTVVKSDVDTLPEPEPLAWWIILLAVLGGLFILIILILLLWKVGFFRRPGTRSGGGPVRTKTRLPIDSLAFTTNETPRAASVPLGKKKERNFLLVGTVLPSQKQRENFKCVYLLRARLSRSPSCTVKISMDDYNSVVLKAEVLVKCQNSVNSDILHIFQWTLAVSLHFRVLVVLSSFPWPLSQFLMRLDSRNEAQTD